MHNLHLLTFLACLVSIECNNDEDFCDPALCPSGAKHIACGHSGEFDPSCPADRKLLHLSKIDIGLILKTHNFYRNKIANGDEAGFQPASRMATMTWNRKLAKLAELNVKQCEMSHDSCRGTSEHLYTGQNLGIRSSTADHDPKEEVIENTIKSWYDEVEFASQQDIDECCESSSGKTIGHFTQLITDRAIQVGCAIASYTDDDWKTSLMACNYAFPNLSGNKVYESGEAASGCTTGANDHFPALCSVDEPVETKL